MLPFFLTVYTKTKYRHVYMYTVILNDITNCLHCVLCFVYCSFCVVVAAIISYTSTQICIYSYSVLFNEKSKMLYWWRTLHMHTHPDKQREHETEQNLQWNFCEITKKNKQNKYLQTLDRHTTSCNTWISIAIIETQNVNKLFIYP